MAWVDLGTAPDQLTAELWLAILRDQGIAAMIRPSDAASYMGLSSFGCRVQVMEEDREKALTALGDVEEEGGEAAPD